jgi:hypothetical protein
MRSVDKFPNGKILGTLCMCLFNRQEVKDLTVSHIGGRYRFVERSFRGGKLLTMRQTDDFHSLEDARGFVDSWLRAKERQSFEVDYNTIEFDAEDG